MSLKVCVGTSFLVFNTASKAPVEICNCANPRPQRETSAESAAIQPPTNKTPSAGAYSKTAKNPNRANAKSATPARTSTWTSRRYARALRSIVRSVSSTAAGRPLLFRTSLGPRLVSSTFRPNDVVTPKRRNCAQHSAVLHCSRNIILAQS